MNSNLLSVGKFYLYGMLVLLFGLGCATSPTGRNASDATTSSEVSLVSDRQSIEKLRENIPPEVRHRNDSLKEILAAMGKVKEHPQKVRQKFDRIQRKRREEFQKDQARQREDFTKNERRQRDEFLDKQKRDRESYNHRSRTREENTRYYSDLDDARNRFFSETKDKRKEFEEESRQKSQDFYSEMREQQKEFNEEWRNYNRRWQDWQNSKNKKSAPGANVPALDDFNQMDSTPGEPLGTDSK